MNQQLVNTIFVVCNHALFFVLLVYIAKKKIVPLLRKKRDDETCADIRDDNELQKAEEMRIEEQEKALLASARFQSYQLQVATWQESQRKKMQIKTAERIGIQELREKQKEAREQIDKAHVYVKALQKVFTNHLSAGSSYDVEREKKLCMNALKNECDQS